MTIKAKLTINTLLAVFIIVALILTGWLSMNNLATLQDQAARLALDSEATALASRAGMSQYQAIADAIIVRDMAATDREWARKKEANTKRIDEMAKGAATPDEKQLVADTRKSFDQIVALYESKLHPLLATTSEITPEMREICRQIGKDVEIIRTSTIKLAELKSKAAREGDSVFDATIRKAMRFMLVIGLIGFVLQFAAGSIIVDLLDRHAAEARHDHQGSRGDI